MMRRYEYVFYFEIQGKFNVTNSSSQQQLTNTTAKSHLHLAGTFTAAPLWKHALCFYRESCPCHDCTISYHSYFVSYGLQARNAIGYSLRSGFFLVPYIHPKVVFYYQVGHYSIKYFKVPFKDQVIQAPRQRVVL